MSDEWSGHESEDLQKEDEISDLFDHSAEDLEDGSLENPSDLTTAPTTLGVPLEMLKSWPNSNVLPV